MTPRLATGMSLRTNRRRLLGAVGAAMAAAAAGCTDRLAGDDPDTDADADGDPDPPADCPTTQGLDVERPDHLTAETAASFVEAYEHVHYRDVLLGYEPESRLDDYRVDVSVQDRPDERDGGYAVEVGGGGAWYRPNLFLDAAGAAAPDGAEQVPHEAVEDEELRALLAAAVDADADDGRTRTRVDPRSDIDDYLETLESLSDEDGLVEEPGDSATLYFRVDDSDVELSVSADTFHGDYWWEARYYVDERVVRRTSGDGADPRDGELLECRPA